MGPEWSSYNASFVPARELEKQGLNITYLLLHNYENYVSKQGFQYVIFDEEKIFADKLKENQTAMMRMKSFPKRPPGKIKKYRLKGILRYRTRLSVMEELEKLLKKLSPRLVLMDPALWTYTIPFLKLNIPIINFSTSMVTYFSTAVPPTFSSIVPNDRPGLFGRAGNLFAWLKLFALHLYADVRKRAKLRFCFGFSSYTTDKKLIKRLGGTLKKTEYLPRLKVPEVVLCPREFDFPTVSHPQLRTYAGTCVDASRKEENTFYWGAIDKDRPIIYCSLGSYSKIWKHRKKLYQSVISVMKKQPRWQLILQMADDEDINQFRPFPENVFVEKWVPHMEVFPSTSIVICHAGIGTVREAIYCGAPMIVFPSGRDDPGTAARIEFHRLGISGNIKTITAAKIESLINQTFNDKQIHTQIKKMQRIFLDQERCEAGVRFIKDFLTRINTE
jgi:MGT family glycosyltransferase